eukprot:TRINITY_DN2388_c0_g1_i6.p3 TRINITY_DN2388_c0_g1~~TRINITY_DN2388_c0_g1_i6.p3  ORF type:complete len:126 (+),score=48.60 TRINITY_DN2388_c0_g1_i6:73-450(+)
MCIRDRYIKAINKGVIPNISTAWESVIDNEIRRGYESALKLYKEKTDKIYNSKDLPMEQDVLLEKLFEVRVECDRVMRRSTKFSEGDSPGKLFQGYVEKLQEAYQSREAEICTKNAKLSEEYSFI